MSVCFVIGKYCFFLGDNWILCVFCINSVMLSCFFKCLIVIFVVDELILSFIVVVVIEFILVIFMNIDRFLVFIFFLMFILFFWFYGKKDKVKWIIFIIYIFRKVFIGFGCLWDLFEIIDCVCLLNKIYD